MILETSRLILREMTEADFADLAQILQDPLVMYAYEHAFDDQEVYAWLHGQMARYRNDGYGLWAVVAKSSGEFLGQAGLTNQDCHGEKVCEVGYLFKRKYWRQGYAAEAAIACRDYAFKVLGKESVYSLIRDSNFPSRKVARRNGMRLAGTLVKHYRGIDMPHLVFRVDRQDSLRPGNLH